MNGQYIAAGMLIGALQHPGDAGKQNLQIVGLGHKVISSQVHTDQLIHIGISACHNNNRHITAFAHLPTDKMTIHNWKIQIQ